MRSLFLSICFVFLSSTVLAQVHVDFKLAPAGKFSADTKEVKGFARKGKDKVTAENIVIPLRNLTTGIGLRDDHMKNKYLEVSKFPEAVLLKAEGKNGEGKGRIKFRGVEKDIQGTYTIKGNEIVAQFDMKMSDFGITGIKYMGVGVNDIAKVTVTLPAKDEPVSAPPLNPPAKK